MNLLRRLVCLCFLIMCAVAFASSQGIGVIQNVPHTKNNSQKSNSPNVILDSLPKFIKDTVAIPFEYKQSALYHPFTFKVIDSVVNILLQNDQVTLSIEGYAHVDEGSDSICYFLSLNRALVVKDYVLGRGVDSSRIISLNGFGNLRSAHIKRYKKIVEFNCRAEILLNYPVPPPIVAMPDRDEDGIADDEDKCPDEYGEKANDGCPNKDAIIVPFEPQQSSLYSMTYNVLDSVIAILWNNPSITISIEGHAYKKEGVKSLCDRLAKERADIVRRYLLTRRIAASRIDSIKSFGNVRPLNAGRNPQEIARNSRAEIFLIRH
jgi:outer membrane protein OmpA-like peptidoglycan-associated protein